jgi:hypothetical protein
MSAIDTLARTFHWPESRPEIDRLPQNVGWLEDGPREVLAGALSAATRVVIELGSWLGLSTRYIASRAPDAIIIAIDHWKGSPEHQTDPKWSVDLPRLYETFLALNWEQRDRVIPIRRTTVEGLRIVAEYGIQPDVIYFDAEHSYAAVSAEIALCRELFPGAILIGDDYDWPGVAPAVIEASQRYKLGLQTLGSRWRAWKLVATTDPPVAAPPKEPILFVDRVALSRSTDSPVVTSEAIEVVDCDAVRAVTHNPKYLTFVGTAQGAGVYPFARICDDLRHRRPEIPILIVESDSTIRELMQCGIDPSAHGNVHVLPSTTRARDYWGLTRVALFPGGMRAQDTAYALASLINGIPIVATTRGDLVEALGRAGLFLPLPARLTDEARVLPTSDEMIPWVETIVQLWDDTTFYAEQRHWALRESGRLGSVDAAGRRVVRALVPATSRQKSVVLVPHLRGIEPECERALSELELAGVRVVRKPGSSAIDLARSELASEALHDGAEAMLFVDADIGFDPADALRILARPEPVVCGVYAKKNRRDVACAFAEEITDVIFGAAAPFPYPLKYAAAGFLRVRADVLRRMIPELKLPLCNTKWGRGVWPFFYPLIIADDGDLHYLAEDWAFSHRLRQIGITPLGDTSIRLWHLGVYGFGWEDAGSDAPRSRSYRFHIG